MEHTHFDEWADDAGNVRTECQTCREGYTFKSRYFARQWSNRHAYGIAYRVAGLAA